MANPWILVFQRNERQAFLPDREELLQALAQAYETWRAEIGQAADEARAQSRVPAFEMAPAKAFELASVMRWLPYTEDQLVVGKQAEALISARHAFGGWPEIEQQRFHSLALLWNLLTLDPAMVATTRVDRNGASRLRTRVEVKLHSERAELAELSRSLGPQLSGQQARAAVLLDIRFRNAIVLDRFRNELTEAPLGVFAASADACTAFGVRGCAGPGDAPRLPGEEPKPQEWPGGFFGAEHLRCIGCVTCMRCEGNGTKTGMLFKRSGTDVNDICHDVRYVAPGQPDWGTRLATREACWLHYADRDTGPGALGWLTQPGRRLRTPAIRVLCMKCMPPAAKPQQPDPVADPVLDPVKPIDELEVEEIEAAVPVVKLLRIRIVRPAFMQADRQEMLSRRVVTGNECWLLPGDSIELRLGAEGGYLPTMDGEGDNHPVLQTTLTSEMGGPWPAPINAGPIAQRLPEGALQGRRRVYQDVFFDLDTITLTPHKNPYPGSFQQTESNRLTLSVTAASSCTLAQPIELAIHLIPMPRASLRFDPGWLGVPVYELPKTLSDSGIQVRLHGWKQYRRMLQSVSPPWPSSTWCMRFAVAEPGGAEKVEALDLTEAPGNVYNLSSTLVDPAKVVSKAKPKEIPGEGGAKQQATLRFRLLAPDPALVQHLSVAPLPLRATYFRKLAVEPCPLKGTCNLMALVVQEWRAGEPARRASRNLAAVEPSEKNDERLDGNFIVYPKGAPAAPGWIQARKTGEYALQYPSQVEGELPVIDVVAGRAADTDVFAATGIRIRAVIEQHDDDCEHEVPQITVHEILDDGTEEPVDYAFDSSPALAPEHKEHLACGQPSGGVRLYTGSQLLPLHRAVQPWEEAAEADQRAKNTIKRLFRTFYTPEVAATLGNAVDSTEETRQAAEVAAKVAGDAADTARKLAAPLEFQRPHSRKRIAVRRFRISVRCSGRTETQKHTGWPVARELQVIVRVLPYEEYAIRYRSPSFTVLDVGTALTGGDANAGQAAASAGKDSAGIRVLLDPKAKRSAEMAPSELIAKRLVRVSRSYYHPHPGQLKLYRAGSYAQRVAAATAATPAGGASAASKPAAKTSNSVVSSKAGKKGSKKDDQLQVEAANALLLAEDAGISTASSYFELLSGGAKMNHAAAARIADNINRVIQVVTLLRSAFSAATELARPTIGWSFSIGLSAFEGDFQWLWGYKEFEDNRAFYWEEIDFNLMIARISIELNLGLEVGNKMVGLAALITGSLSLTLGYQNWWQVDQPEHSPPVVTRNPPPAAHQAASDAMAKLIAKEQQELDKFRQERLALQVRLDQAAKDARQAHAEASAAAEQCSQMLTGLQAAVDQLQPGCWKPGEAPVDAHTHTQLAALGERASERAAWASDVLQDVRELFDGATWWRNSPEGDPGQYIEAPGLILAAAEQQARDAIDFQRDLKSVWDFAGRIVDDAADVADRVRTAHRRFDVQEGSGWTSGSTIAKLEAKLVLVNENIFKVSGQVRTGYRIRARKTSAQPGLEYETYFDGVALIGTLTIKGFINYRGEYEAVEGDPDGFPRGFGYFPRDEAVSDRAVRTQLRQIAQNAARGHARTAGILADWEEARREGTQSSCQPVTSRHAEDRLPWQDYDTVKDDWLAEMQALWARETDLHVHYLGSHAVSDKLGENAGRCQAIADAAKARNELFWALAEKCTEAVNQWEAFATVDDDDYDDPAQAGADLAAAAAAQEAIRENIAAYKAELEQLKWKSLDREFSNCLADYRWWLERRAFTTMWVTEHESLGARLLARFSNLAKKLAGKGNTVAEAEVAAVVPQAIAAPLPVAPMGSKPAGNKAAGNKAAGNKPAGGPSAFSQPPGGKSGAGLSSGGKGSATVAGKSASGSATRSTRKGRP